MRSIAPRFVALAEALARAGAPQTAYFDQTLTGQNRA